MLQARAVIVTHAYSIFFWMQNISVLHILSDVMQMTSFTEDYPSFIQ